MVGKVERNNEVAYSKINRGAMFARQKYKETSPDQGGDITLGGDVLDYIVDQYRQGNQEINVSIIGYRQISKNNKPYTSLALTIPQENPGQGYGGRQESRAPSSMGSAGYQRTVQEGERYPSRQQNFNRPTGVANERDMFQQRETRGAHYNPPQGGRPQQRDFSNNLDKDDIPFSMEWR